MTTGGIVRWGIADGILTLIKYLRTSNFTTWGYRSRLFGIAVAMMRGAVTLVPAGYAVWLGWKRWKNWMRDEAETDGQ